MSGLRHQHKMYFHLIILQDFPTKEKIRVNKILKSEFHYVLKFFDGKIYQCNELIVSPLHLPT